MATKSNTKAVVCLRDSAFGNAGQVVELTIADAATAKEQGAVDDAPAAVAYARESKGA